jgi:HEPN domain-containing protein
MDFAAMESLFSSGHYVWALFVGHLVIEKILKALYVKRVGLEVPRSHNLLAIAEKTGLELNVEQKASMDEMTGFNIRARYPDVKRRFLKKATHAFTEKRLTQIRELRIWLLEQARN